MLAVTFIAINGLVGLNISPVDWMATLPVMGYVVGGALSTSLVAKTQHRWGRKKSFQLGLAIASLSSLTCAYAAWTSNFWLLTVGTLIAGYYLSLIHISEPTRLQLISYAVFCLKKKFF